jgi:hypothetical protein
MGGSKPSLIFAVIAHFLGQPHHFIQFVIVFSAYLNIPVIKDSQDAIPVVAIGTKGWFT